MRPRKANIRTHGWWRMRLAFEQLEIRQLLSVSPSVAPASDVATPTYELLNRVIGPVPGISPATTSGPTGFTASQIRTAYGISQVSFDGGTVPGNGTGQTIAIVDTYDYPTASSDLHNFDVAMGLPDPPSFQRVSQTGSTTTLPITDPAGAGSGDDWEVEEALDVEWAHAIAPDASILLVEANSASNSDLFTAVNYARQQPGVVAVSMSWGESESSSEVSNDSYLTTPSGHSGVTFVASTGDDGAPGGYPAYSPNVLAVGGTTLTTGNSSGTYQSETGWSGSGGGISTYEPQPSFQNGVVTQSSTQRTIPDISFDADPSSGVSVYDSYDYGSTDPWLTVGGTSVAAPCWSGLIAVVDQGRSVYGLPSLDGPTGTLPALYKLPQSDFHDITSGSNGFSAGPGYDLVTGRGTPVANALVPGLVGVNQPPTINPVSNPAAIPENSSAQTIGLSGISPGPPSQSGQTVTITATSNNTSLIPNPTVNYANPSTTGTLSYMPAADAYGSAVITLTVTNSGGTANGGVNTFTETFTVTVTQINLPPTIAPIAGPQTVLVGAGPQSVSLTGISYGPPGNLGQTVTITATSSNPSLVPNPAITYTSPNATGTLTYTPSTSATGSAVITVTVNNNGGTANGGVQTYSETFTIDVYPLNVLSTSTAAAYSPPNPTFGQSVTLTATVSSTTTPNEGSVTFMYGTTTLGTAPVSSGAATLNVTSLPAGTPAVTASYTDPLFNYLNSTSPPINVTIAPAMPTVAVSDSGGVYKALGYVASATVNGGASLESVSPTLLYYTGTAASGTGIPTAPSHVGTYTAVASFAGSADYVAAQSNPVTFVITPAPLTITANNASKVYGAALPALTASYVGLAGGDTSASLTTQPALSTTATAASPVSGNPYPITIGGAVDPDYTISYAAGALTVVAAATTTSLTATPLTTTYDQMVTWTATVTGTPVPSEGTVTFTSGSKTLGTQAVVGGAATLSYALLPAGVDVVTATYTDSAGNFAGSSTPAGQGSIIRTVAGDGAEGSTGNGGQATAASLNTPSTVAVDSAGDIFIADVGNNWIREVNAVTGVITTVAGTGVAGFSGNGGPATAAELDRPFGIALDSAGDLFIADEFNDVIREVNAVTHTITTVAGTGTAGYGGDGGPATAALLDGPTGITVDSAGDLIIADFQNDRIREVNAATGVITTIAGNGTAGYGGNGGPATAASLHLPESTVLDSAGDLFIADEYNNVVREVNAVTHVITTFAGTGAAGYGGDGGPATAALLNEPREIAVDAAGDLFISDEENSRVREVNAVTHVLTTFAGTGVATYSGDGGAATAAALNNQLGITLDAAGDVFIADFDNERIREVTAGTLGITVRQATPGVTVSDAGGTYSGSSFAATALVAGVVGGVDTTPAASLEGVSPTLVYYAGSSTSGSRLAAAPSAAGTYTVIGSFTGSADYAAASSSPITFVIAPALLTVTANNQAKTYGAPLPVLGGAISGEMSGDGITASFTTSATSSSHVVAGGYPIAGFLSDPNGKLANYTVVYVNGTLNVTPASLTISANNLFMTYGAALPPLTASYSGFVNGDTPASLTTPPTLATTATAGSPGSGTPYPITVSGAIDADYSITYVAGGLTITSLPTPAVTVGDAGGTYDGSAFAAAGTVNGSASLEGVSPTFTYYSGSSAGGTPLAGAPTAAGTYAVVANFAGSTDYNPAQSSPAEFVISPTQLTVTTNNQTKAYGAALPTLTGSVSGEVAGDGITASYSTTGAVGSPVAGGGYPITATLKDPNGKLQNYTVVYVSGTLTVTPAPLTITANSQTKVYGAALSAFTASYAGFVDGDTPASFTTPPTLSTSATATSPVSGGPYAIIAGGAVDSNYNISYVAGSLTVTPAQTTTAASMSTFNSTFGQAVTLKATVSGSPTPSEGTVTFMSGSTTLGTQAIVGSSAILSYALLPAGIDVITAVYADSVGNFAGSAAPVSQSSMIRTVAGAGTAGYGGDGGQATAASLETTDVAVDSAGDLFIADAGANRVREVNALTGVITTVAGTGTASYSGNGGQATAASLDDPFAVTVDSAGDLFIADYGNNVIREVNAITHIITTVAGTGVAGYGGDGGQATAAFLNQPIGITVDSAGDLIIADFHNDRIREVNAATGLINTIAGTGAAGYSGDGGLATAASLQLPQATVLDSAGDLFIADEYNDVVREVNAVTHVITTFAGTGAPGFGGDGGPATAAYLDAPRYLALDSAGDLFISDQLNERIREINATTHVITTYAGNGSGTFSGDGGPATAASINFALGIACDAAGDLFISDQNNYRIREVTVRAAGITVSQAAPSLSVSASGGTYSGSSFAATATVAGVVSGIDTTPAPSLEGVTPTLNYYSGTSALGTTLGAAPTHPGTYTVLASFSGSLDYTSAARSMTFSIAAATTAIAVLDVGGAYSGASYPGTASVNGGSSLESVTPTLTYYSGTAATGTALSAAPSAAGTYTVLASFAGSTDYTSAAASTTFSIAAAATAIAVTDVGGAYSGASYPATVSVNGGSSLEGITPSLTFYSGASSTGLALGGPPTAAGTYTVLASFAGSTDYTSAVASMAFAVSQAAPALSVSDNSGTFTGNPFVASDSVAGVGSQSSPSASLESVTPSLTYYLGAAATGLFLSGAPSIAGTYTALISFAGSTDYSSATASSTFTINQASPTISVSDNSAVFTGAPFTAATSSIEGGTPTLTYYSGTTTSGSASTGAPSTAGTYTVLASFAGSADYTSGTASSTFTISPAVASVSASDGGTYTGSAFPATATVNGSSSLEGVRPTISYYSGTVVSGLPLTSAPLLVGTYAAVASFAGSADYQAGQSAPVTFAITPAPTTISLAASATIVGPGQDVILTATVQSTSVVNEGTVAFSNNGLGIGTAAVTGGVATLTTADLNLGSNTLSASYSDSPGNFAASTVPPAIITTVAGGGSFDNGGRAAAAELEDPVGVAVDSAGDIFIADTLHDVIREVNHVTGIISTYAGDGAYGSSGDGGLATAAELNGPLQIALDSAGNLYIADQNNQRIREVNVVTGVITTVAGDGMYGDSGNGGSATAAELGAPGGIAVDSAGDLFIANFNNNSVQEVNAVTRIITTVAGNGTVGFAGDGGPGTAAELDGPEGLAVDSAGDLFIADFDNQRIRELDLASGLITTVAGTSLYGYNGDGIGATAAQLSFPTDIVVDASGNLFIADYGDQRIREINATTHVITTVAGNGTQAFAGDGGPATAAELDYPAGLALDSSGDLYIGDRDNNRVRELFARTDILTTVAGNGLTTAAPGTGPGPATLATLAAPQSVALDSSGDLFIADPYDNVVLEVNHLTGVLTTIAGAGTDGYESNGLPATASYLAFPDGVAVDSSGNVYISDHDSSHVLEVNHATGIITTIAGNGGQGFSGDGGPATLASLDEPAGLALDSAGDLFIADLFDSRIREVNLATGIITTVAGGGPPGYGGDGAAATAAELDHPQAVAVDSAGNLYIADTDNDRIREVNAATGIISTLAGNSIPGYGGDGGPATAAMLDSPSGVAVDSAGNVFVADTDDYRVREINAATGTITTIAGNGTPGFSGDGGPATAAQLGAPVGLAVGSSGGLFIVDAGNERVREYTPGGLVYVQVPVPTVSVSDSGGAYNGSPYPATATVNGAASLQGVSPTLTYYSGTATSGSALAGAPTGAGTYTVVASFAGSSGYGPASSSPLTFAVSPAATTVSVLAAGSYIDAGEALTLNAAVGGFPRPDEGTVTFFVDGNLLGSAPVTAGVAAFTTTLLPVGTDVITASYYDPAGNFMNGSSGTISTLAGDGYNAPGFGGYSGDGGPATAAELYQPGAVAVDSAGDVFIADTVNGRVREVNAITGIITTVAGNGANAGNSTGGFSGQGGPATAAALDDPVALAFDSAGDLFIGDSGIHRVLEVNHLTDVITSIAGNGADASTGDGGPATAATLDDPAGIAFDSAGDLFISDAGANRVREVNYLTGIISTVAGDGTAWDVGDGGPATAAGLYAPVGIAINSAGDLFIADEINNRIREVNPAGIISTVAGSYAQGNTGDGGPATAAALALPADVVLDSAGDLFFDSGGSIREVTAGGIINTIAGTGDYGPTGDGGPATAAMLWNPFGVAVDSAGDLFIADSGSNRIREVTLNAEVTVAPELLGPAVTDATAMQNQQSTSGLVITPNPLDAGLANYFQITGITGGTLYLNDGQTPVTDGQFITVAQGAAGLKFTPTPNSSAAGSFVVAESLVAAVRGLGGSTATAYIDLTVRPPTSSVDPLGYRTSNTRILLSWSGAPGTGGPITSYNILVSTDGGTFTPWLAGTTETSATFTAQTGHTYDFISQASDTAGNLEPAHTTADTAVTVMALPWQNPGNPLNVLGLSPATTVPADALAIIDYLNLHPGSSSLPATAPAGSDYYDVLGRNDVVPADALAVIDYLNLHPTSPTVAPAAIGPAVAPAPAEAAVFGVASDPARIDQPPAAAFAAGINSSAAGEEGMLPVSPAVMAVTSLSANTGGAVSGAVIAAHAGDS